MPTEAVIPDEKLTRYLLLPRDYDDKSQYLALAGFTQDNPGELLAAIHQLSTTQEAVYDGTTEYGDFYRVEGDLLGVNDRRLPVVTIWLRWHQDGSFHCITLKPQKKKG